jgi:mRNA interferase RelE/StbE
MLASRAVRELRDLPRDVIRRIDEAIGSLAESPRPPGCKKLRSKAPEGWRIRVGDYRILYQVDDAQRRVLVYRIGHRRNNYD